MLRRSAQFLLTLIFVMTAFGVSLAQSTGSIKGTVADSNGAVVAGATIEATNDNTGEKRSTSSADNGSYVLRNLPV